MTRLRWPATLEDGRKVIVTTGYERNPGRYFFSVTERNSGTVVATAADLFPPILSPHMVVALLDDLKLARPPSLIQQLRDTSQRHSDIRTYHPYELLPFGAVDGPDQTEVLAQAGYEAFYVGDSGVPWAQLTLPLREAWTRAAQAIAATLHLTGPVIDGAPLSALLEQPQAEGVIP